jgi:hypothetical protein
MKKILVGLAATLTGLGLAGNADASPPHEHGGARHGHVVHVGAYHEVHGRHFRGGWYYSGRDHHHWTRTVWDSHWHRYHYWDPGLNCWYYWYAPGNCYYPVGYCP